MAAVTRAVAVGCGLAPLPCFSAESEPGLRRLTDEVIGSRDILLVVHPDLSKVGRVRKTMDFLIEVFTRDVKLWAG